jgi:hypothetical protein
MGKYANEHAVEWNDLHICIFSNLHIYYYEFRDLNSGKKAVQW